MMTTSLLLLLAALPVIDAPVVDTAEVLSADAETSLSTKLREHHTTTGVQLAVLTVRTTNGEPINEYAQRVAEAWRGGTKGRDDGALFVLAVDDRTMRLELGYGLEPLIPDSVASGMLSSLRPALRTGAYDKAATWLVDDFITRTAPGAAPAPVTAAPVRSGFFERLVALVSFSLVTVAFAALGYATRRRRDAQEHPTTEPFTLVMLHLLLVGVFTGAMVFLGQPFALWLPALAGGLLGYHAAPLTPLITVPGFVVPSVAWAWLVSSVVDNPLDAALFAGIPQLGLFVFILFKAMKVEFVDLDTDGVYGGGGARHHNDAIFGALGSSRRSSSSSSSSWSSSSSSSSSSSRSSSSSGGGYSGGGGSFGGGGASSNW